MARLKQRGDSRDLRHGGIVHFQNDEARQQFVDEALKHDPSLVRHMHLAEGRPDLVFEGLSADQLDEARVLVGSRGKWFDEIQFETF